MKRRAQEVVMPGDIHVITERISPARLERLVRESFDTIDQQILMIGNEMNRAGKLRNPDDRERRASAYERVLYLTDLTIQAHSRRGLRRELPRWRDLAALGKEGTART